MIRKNIINKFDLIIENPKISTDIEKGIYNYSIKKQKKLVLNHYGKISILQIFIKTKQFLYGLI